MAKKSVILSSAGLRNLVIQNQNDDFTMKFGQLEIKVHKLFAEFLSPKISHLHHCDPTIDCIQFYDDYSNKINDFNNKIDDFITDEIINLIQDISRGYPIELDQHTASKFRYLCLLLENDELLSQINSLFPIKYDQMEFSEMIEELKNIQSIPSTRHQQYYSNMIDHIAIHFSTYSHEELKELPKTILYSIILNEHFKHEDEDGLIELIDEIFSKEEKIEYEISEDDEEEEGIKRIQFYEIVEISKLSLRKFQEMIGSVDYEEMTGTLWNKLNDFIQNQLETANSKPTKKQSIIRIEYKNESNQHQGIIQHLSDEYGVNICDKGIISVTASSHSENAKYVADIQSDQFYQSKFDTYKQWIKYDFKEMRIRPTVYSIRTRTDGNCRANPQKWVIEGSNTDDENDWKILDKRKSEASVSKANLTGVFNITTSLSPNESYRYIRLRQTGYSTDNSSYLTLAALEFFGDIFLR